MIKRGETTRPVTCLFGQLSRLIGLSELNRPLVLCTGMGTPVTGGNATGGLPVGQPGPARERRA